jgi:hypothetical protein
MFQTCNILTINKKSSWCECGTGKLFLVSLKLSELSQPKLNVVEAIQGFTSPKNTCNPSFQPPTIPGTSLFIPPSTAIPLNLKRFLLFSPHVNGKQTTLLF